MERITYLGKQIYPRERKPRRDTRGRFTVKSWLQAKWFAFMSFIRFLVKVTVAGVLIGLLLGAAYGIGVLSTSDEVSAVNSPIAPIVAAAAEDGNAKANKALDAIIEEIAEKESGNVEDSAALVVFDDNKAGTLPRKDKLSYGCMMYKISTVQRHYKAVYGKDLNNLEATMLALNCDQAKSLARAAILKIKGSLYEWSVATHDQGVQVDLIRKMLSE